jgi:hypothetical protein
MPIYGAKTQYAKQDETPPLAAKQCLNIQQVTGSVLYYARAVDPTVLMPLNNITTEQTKATKKTQAATNRRPDRMGPLVAGLIMSVLDLPQPALPIRWMKEMVI